MAAAETHALLPGIADPFPGLRPFESDEEVIFRGRQKQTEELLRRLAENRFLAVVGTSGSGKSSLVRAGLLPALDRGYLAGASSRWRIAVTRPGMAPIDNLVDALQGKGTHQAAIQGGDAAALRSSSLGLVEIVQQAQLGQGESLLVVADQFEELFHYYRRMANVDGGSEAALYVNLLLTAARRPDVPIYVVLTMRSDFLGDCSQFPGLPEALSESQYLIPRLTREQRRQAMVEPLRLFGASMTPQLIERLLNDSGEESSDFAAGASYRGGAPDTLPVLQHALMRTYLEWKALPGEKASEPINLKQYQDAGGMGAALNRHAERLFEKELDDKGRHWAERIFRSLTTTELGRPVRRPTPLTDLYKIVGAQDVDRNQIDDVIALFRRRENSFLQLNKDASVDISHESLIWKWERLSRWVAEEAAGAELYRDLVKDAGGKATWGEPKLLRALAIRNESGWNADWAEQYSRGSFKDVEAFLVRSETAVRNQKWLRWFGLASAIAILVLGVWVYFSGQEAGRKARELEAVKIARDSLVSDLTKRKQAEEEMAQRLNGLKNEKGSTQEERDRIAAEKKTLEEQLSKSQQESQRLTAQAQQSSTDLLANVKTLQSQLTEAQRDAAKARQDAEAKQSQLAAALRERDEAVKARQEAEAKTFQGSKQPEKPETAHTLPTEAAPVAQSDLQPRTNLKDGLVYVWIPPGAFTMGCSPGDDQCRENEKPPHREQIAEGFWLGQTEVTQAAWKKVQGDRPSHFKGDQLPVENVAWVEAANYCKAIGGRLPTEKEWEYAARAGTTGSRYGEIGTIAWYSANSKKKTHPVGQKKPNAYALYDMLGNVWEWTDLDGGKVLRGGSWVSYSQFARASYRRWYPPTARGSNVGFRCVGEFH